MHFEKVTKGTALGGLSPQNNMHASPINQHPQPTWPHIADPFFFAS